MANSPITSPLNQSEKEMTAKALQATLVDLLDLTLVAKQAHWNVIGPHFRGVHLQLDEVVDAARRFTDSVAERSTSLGASPDGRAMTIAENSKLSEYPDGWQSTQKTVAAVTDCLGQMIRRMRARIDETDKSDLVTQDLLIDITSELEKQHWMWQVQQA